MKSYHVAISLEVAADDNQRAITAAFLEGSEFHEFFDSCERFVGWGLRSTATRFGSSGRRRIP